MRSALIAALVLATTASASPVKSIEQVVEAYDLSGSYEFVFPSKALAWRDSDEYILGKWDVNSHGVQFGTNDM
jgi:hypothetical protein